MEALHDDTFREIAAVMREAIGVSFADSKKPLVASRLSTRIQRLGLAGFDDYLALVTDPGGGELQMAVDLLTTNETYFFREPAHFELLRDEIARTRPPAPLVWSAACSFGDEAFSVAMILSELERQGSIGGNWSVLGTDISDRVLRAACGATYPQERLRSVSREQLRSHCLRGEDGADGLVRMQDHLRQRVQFASCNLSREIEPIGPFDAIFLRNVLIYFDVVAKRDITDRVLQHLRPGGLFFLGTAEGRATCDTPLQTLAPGAFRKLPC